MVNIEYRTSVDESSKITIRLFLEAVMEKCLSELEQQRMIVQYTKNCYYSIKPKGEPGYFYVI